MFGADSVDFSPVLTKALFFFYWAEALAVADPAADGICYGFQDLVVSPAVAPFTQGFWAVAEDLLQGSSPLAEGESWCLHLSPGEEVEWTWQRVVDRLDQEFYLMGFGFRFSSTPARTLYLAPQ